jgi:Methylamine utilization protein MauJ
MSENESKNLCHCCSGLPLRRCHGSVLKSPGEIPVGTGDPNAPEERVSLVGFPGTHQTMHMLYRFKGDDPRNNLPLGGSPGLYEVTFILHRPGYKLQQERQISFSSGLRGDSHLAISKPAFSPPGNPDADQILIFGVTEDGKFEFIGSNEKGYLGKLITRPFQANNRGHAEENSYRVLATHLSNMSLHLDIPLEIGVRETKEISNGSISMSFVLPYLEAPMAINATSNFGAEFRSYAALYREALNTNSPVYQFLCLFKILEALGARRKRLAREAKKNNTSYVSPDEVLPGTPAEVKAWLEGLFYIRPPFDLSTLESAVPQDLRGRKATDIIKADLKPLRIKVAHALFGSGGELPLSSDDLNHTHSITRRMLVTKCLVREC